MNAKYFLYVALIKFSNWTFGIGEQFKISPHGEDDCLQMLYLHFADINVRLSI